MFQVFTICTALLASQVAAHGYLNTITLDGTKHEGFNRWNPRPDPKAIGWSYATDDEGPELDLSSPDFVCRRSSKPSKNYGTIQAGKTATFFWTSDDKEINPDGWAVSHHGAVLTYIAPCGGECTTVDKTKLKWTKIAEEGLISGPANTKGFWATDKLRQNGGINSATIPANIAPGKYVVRNELIALHRANLKEPEFYMQCGNIEVTGSGTDNLSGSGVLASKLYSTSDKQLFGFDIYDSRATEWKTPGPALYSGQASTKPVDDEPVSEEPVAEEPVAEEPVADEPVADEPVTEEPVADEPVADEPVTEEPVADEPVTEEPVADEPVTEEPVADEPVSDKPVSGDKPGSGCNARGPRKQKNTRRGKVAVKFRA